MPYIVIIADEMADLMMTAAKEVESHIVRLAQKSAPWDAPDRATQKPTVDVITGLIKGNLPPGSPSRSPAGRTRASSSTRWGPTSCWATATCCS
jgi:hypothetical protein